MLKIYVKDGCPFCAAVLSKVDALQIEIEEKNVSEPQNTADMIRIGGKRQEPFLYDEEKDIKMYESANIIEYLNKIYGDGATNGEVNVPEGVCPV